MFKINHGRHQVVSDATSLFVVDEDDKVTAEMTDSTGQRWINFYDVEGEVIWDCNPVYFQQHFSYVLPAYCRDET
jgi:hypothetical protein